MSGNLYSIFAAHRPAHPDRTFIERPDGSRITYGDVERDSARIANILKEMGLTPGDRVAIQVEKSAEALLLYLACLRLGCVYIPFNTAYTIAELRYLIADAEPKLFVTRPERVAEAAELGVEHLRTLGT